MSEADIKIIKESYVMVTKHKLDENNKRLKQAIENVLKELEHQTNLSHYLQSKLDKSDAERLKLDKIIDEMVEYIAYITDCPSENCGTDLDCEEECDCEKDRTKKCWKKYFYKKVEGERKC